ncbi:hypothetical protein ACFWQC_02025 [Nocardioides sp. NPDC058538]|uniref:hypothetical protein n=1 Tax=Nocardioides sp. NPDC058538 TaxID=3346542 RepID=UPI00365A2AC6
MATSGPLSTFEFDLVATAGALNLSTELWLKLQWLLYEMQPSEASQPRERTQSHHVTAKSADGVADALHRRIERHRGQTLRFVRRLTST